jgi:hypothetical protein
MGLWEQRIAGIALVAGNVVFFGGVSIPLFSGLSLRVWSAPLPEYLELIAAHRAAWLWTNGGIILGVLLTAVGLSALTALLNEAGDRLLARAGLLLFAMGVMFWLIELTFRLSVTVWAAGETVIMGAPPPFFEPLHQWVELLFFIYMVLAYLATAAYGGALLQTASLPDWLGWVTLGVGVFGAISFIAGLPTIFSIPAGVHLMPLLTGIVLLA